jgi:hypothetical protein
MQAKVHKFTSYGINIIDSASDAASFTFCIIAALLLLINGFFELNLSFICHEIRLMMTSDNSY